MQYVRKMDAGRWPAIYVGACREKAGGRKENAAALEDQASSRGAGGKAGRERADLFDNDAPFASGLRAA